MRELTKSVTSFSWALSVFGARQALTFLRQPIPNGDHPATRGFDAVARTAGSSTEGWLRGVFEAGDRLQRSSVDLMFAMVTLGNGDVGNLGRVTDRTLQATGDALQAAVPGIGSDSVDLRGGGAGYRAGGGAPGAGTAGRGAGGTGGAAEGGWGPMPPLPDVPELADDRSGDARG